MDRTKVGQMTDFQHSAKFGKFNEIIGNFLTLEWKNRFRIIGILCNSQGINYES